MSARIQIEPAHRQAIRAAANFELWRMGNLRSKLDPMQRALYEQIRGTAGKQFCVEGARKLGKTYLHGLIAVETCLQNPGKQVNWVSGTAIGCRKVLVPVLEEVTATASPDFKGEYHEQTGQWRFPNAAFIQIFGAETKRDCERGRGPSSILNIADESGFMALLEYMLDSVFSPQLRRVRRLAGSFVGMTLLCSTTPYTPDHHFCKVADASALEGAYANRTIYDSGFESPQDIERYIASEAAKKGLTTEAFKETSTFKREYLSQRVVDTDVVVIPEFSAAAPHVVRGWPRPVGFERYVYKRVSVDPGSIDKTGILAGYVDFATAKVVVAGERLLNKPNTETLAKEVRALEQSLWPEADERRTHRVIDDPHGRMVLDLWDLQHLRFEQAIKHDREASIGIIRTWLQSHRLLIDPSCTQLQKQLLTATRNKSGKDFERNEEGHFDLVAALMYFVRGLSLTTNPYPSDFDVLTGRELPAHHPLVARRELTSGPREMRGLAGAILSGNPYVQGQLRRRR